MKPLALPYYMGIIYIFLFICATERLTQINIIKYMCYNICATISALSELLFLLIFPPFGLS